MSHFVPPLPGNRSVVMRAFIEATLILIGFWILVPWALLTAWGLMT